MRNSSLSFLECLTHTHTAHRYMWQYFGLQCDLHFFNTVTEPSWNGGLSGHMPLAKERN